MKEKSLRQLGIELGVSASYLSQVINNKRPASEKVLSKLEEYMSVSVKQVLSKLLGENSDTYKHNFKTGGSAWESNPPKTLSMPSNGFEVREAHQDSSAP